MRWKIFSTFNSNPPIFVVVDDFGMVHCFCFIFQLEKLKLHFDRDLLKQAPLFSAPPPPPPLCSCNCGTSDQKYKHVETLLTSFNQTNLSLQKRNEELTNQLLMLLIQSQNNQKIKVIEDSDGRNKNKKKEKSTFCSIM